jgi:hypothetical protein
MKPLDSIGFPYVMSICPSPYFFKKELARQAPSCRLNRDHLSGKLREIWDGSIILLSHFMAKYHANGDILWDTFHGIASDHQIWLEIPSFR